MLIGPRLSQQIAHQTRLSQQIARLSVEISGETRILQPSDDPVASARIAALSREATDRAAWRANATDGAALAAQVDDALAAIKDGLDRAAEIVTAARSVSGDPAVARAELRQLAEEMGGRIAATDSRGQRLFPDLPIRFPVSGAGLATATGTAAAAFGEAGDTLADRLAAAADAVAAGDDAAMAAALDAIASGQSRVADEIGAHGVRAAYLDTVVDRLTAADTLAVEERSGLEDTDITRALPAVQAKQLTLEAAQAAFTRINRRTLFDLLG